ncbi:MAG: guanylate kinase [Lachnospiraceae bacterium]|nr:guanylate kinase [Lachnospiraceae bacterium]
MDRSDKGILVVVSGFAGTGKGTLMKSLIREYEGYALSVSMTTRQPRQGEAHGREYFFVTREEFEEKIAQQGLLEYACYCDNYYGTPREYVEACLAGGKDVILEIELQGALKIKKQYPEALLLFVMPPSAAELYRRLLGRGTESEEVIRKRLLRALDEARGIENYDYIVINDDLQTCVKQMHHMIRAARNTPARNMEFIEDVRQQLDDLLKGEK